MNKFLAFTGLALFLLFGCSHSNETEPARSETADKNMVIGGVPSSVAESPAKDLKDDMAKTDNTMPDRMTSGAARIDPNDTVHRFIRTADLRFRVKDVLQTSMSIEDLVSAQGGFVTGTELQSLSEGTELIPISADSLLEISHYSVQNHMTVRVPAARLDSTLRALAKWVDLFDRRNVSNVDVRLDLLRNTLAARREQAHGNRVHQAMEGQAHKLKETTTAGEAVLRSAENADNARLANMELQDRIEFSTVQLDLYQRRMVKRTVIANEHSVEGYKPALLSRTGAALVQGWRLLWSLVIGLLSAWPVVLIIVGAGWLLLHRRKNTGGK